MFGGSSCDEIHRIIQRKGHCISIWTYWAYSDHYQLVNQEIHGGSHFLLQIFALPWNRHHFRAFYSRDTHRSTDYRSAWTWLSRGFFGGSSEGSHGCISKKRGTIWSNELSFPAKLNWFWKNCHKTWHFMALGSIQSQAKWESGWICVWNRYSNSLFRISLWRFVVVDFIFWIMLSIFELFAYCATACAIYMFTIVYLCSVFKHTCVF